MGGGICRALVGLSRIPSKIDGASHDATACCVIAPLLPAGRRAGICFELLFARGTAGCTQQLDAAVDAL